MRQTILLLTVLCCFHNISTAQTSCSSGFAKRIGSPLTNESGSSIAIDAPENVLYLAGYSNDSTLLLKVSSDGEILWSRTFDLLPSQGERVATVLFDSDGMMVISGMSNQDTGGDVFVMRYDVDQDTILWANRYWAGSNNYAFQLIEKEPGGNFIVSHNPSNTTYAELLELDRLTGIVQPIFSKYYALGNSQTFWGLVMHEGSLYATGRFADGFSQARFRNVLAKLNANDGTPEWIKLGHKPANTTARLYGSALVIDQNSIYSLSHGDPVGVDPTDDQLFIQNTNLNGQNEWIKFYQLPGVADVSDEILATGDGFIIMGRNRGPSDIFLFKINHAGEVLWARKYDFSENDNTFYSGGATAQLVRMNNALYFTAFAESGSRRDLLLVRTDLEGKLDSICAGVTTMDIAVSDVTDAVYYDIQPQVIEFLPVTTAIELNSKPSTLQTGTICVSLADIETVVEESICMGDVFEGYDQAGTFVDTFPLPNGCDSVRILHLRLLNCDPLVVYDLDACSSYMSNGSNMDYTEFLPEYPEVSTCAAVSAGYLFRSPPQENKHSCTPGLNDTPAMCVSSLAGCTYLPGHEASVVIEFTLTPEPSAIFQFTAMEFYEKAPSTYSWLDGGSGPNNYPTRFGIRILKNGTEIYRNPNIATGTSWSLKEFDFTDDTLFQIEVPTLFRIELLPYCPIGNGAAVSAWDVEDVVIIGGCVRLPGEDPLVSGSVLTAKGKPVEETEIQISHQSTFSVYEYESVLNNGKYNIKGLQTGKSYFLKGFNDKNFLQGVSTLDLVLIQKHLLGITPFTTLDQYVAADINHDGRLNVSDLIALRRALLGYISFFPGNTSWRFGVWPQPMDIQDPSALIETAYIESLDYGLTENHFLGIKIGDLNGDAIRINNPTPLPDRPNPFVIELKDAEMIIGNEIRIEVKADENIEVEGLQFSWQLDGLAFSGIEKSILDIHEEHISILDDGLLRLSWAANHPFQVRKGDILFTLIMKAEKNSSISDAIREAPEFLVAEIYSDDKAKPVKLVFEDKNINHDQNIGSIEVAPNPFRQETNLRFEIYKDSNIQLDIFDAAGKAVYHYSAFLEAGEYSQAISSAGMNDVSGVLYCRIICGKEITMKKIISLE